MHHKKLPIQFGYPSGFKLGSVFDQIARLYHACDMAGVPLNMGSINDQAKTVTSTPLPEGAEGWGVALRAGLVGPPEKERSLARELLRTLKPACPLDDRFDMEIEHDERFMIHTKTEEARTRLSDESDSDLIIFPVQFGIRYAQVSDDQAISSF